MRMNPLAGRSAYDVLMSASETELAEIFYEYGQERASRKIARAIVYRRKAGSFPGTTLEFARMISGLLHRPGDASAFIPRRACFKLYASRSTTNSKRCG